MINNNLWVLEMILSSVISGILLVILSAQPLSYLVFFKLTHSSTSTTVLGLFRVYGYAYERRNDTCNLTGII